MHLRIRDIREDKDNYVIDIDLPGFDKKNIKIDITDGYLTINAKVNNEDNAIFALIFIFITSISLKDNKNDIIL